MFCRQLKGWSATGERRVDAMWLIAWRDLQLRRRRFVISVVAVAFVLAITLLLAGLSNFFTVESRRAVTRLGADAWVVSDRATGPFLGAALLPASAVDEVTNAPGVDEAGGVVFRHLTADDPRETSVNLIGAAPDGVGMPQPTTGRTVAANDEAVVDQRLGRGVGETVVIGDTPLTVVGVVRGSTALAGSPNVFVTLDTAQAISFAGQPIISTIAARGDTAQMALPDGFVAMSNAQAVDDLAKPLAQARDTIAFLSVLLWIIAACIIGSIIYLSALERLRDFAVCKAIGVSSRWVLGSLLLQAVVLALVATALALLLSMLLSPLFPLPNEIARSSLVALPITAVVVSALASVVGVRRAVSVDPALAFA